MIERCQAAKFDAIALTVDTIVSGKRERCARSGFTSPPKFTPRNLLGYALKPRWGLDYLLREKFALPNLDTHVQLKGPARRFRLPAISTPCSISRWTGRWPSNCATIGAAISR
jgi:isopentenyl diphosphate isomerase/L-lactate dehydrogenase-like FMN-dependent dehydrogenase